MRERLQCGVRTRAAVGRMCASAPTAFRPVGIILRVAHPAAVWSQRSLAARPEQTEQRVEEQRRKMARESAALPSMMGSVANAFDAPTGRSCQKAGSAHPRLQRQLMEKRVDMLQETMQEVMDQGGASRIEAHRIAGK